MTDLHFGIITGLTLEENRQLATLAEVFNYHQPYNETKDKYYEGHITLNDVVPRRWTTLPCWRPPRCRRANPAPCRQPRPSPASPASRMPR